MAFSKAKAASSASSGGFGLVTVIASVVSFFSNPTFTGWAGVGKSLLVGSGTSMGATIVGGIGGLVGGVLGAAFGLAARGITGKKVSILAPAFAGAVLGGLGGAGYGIYKGYSLSNEWLTQKAEITQPAAAVTAPEKSISYAPQAYNAAKTLTFKV